VRREQRTHEPAAFVARLVAEHGGEPEAVEIVRPSLEDVYLGLVSRPSTLRQAQGTASSGSETSSGGDYFADPVEAPRNVEQEVRA